MNASEDWHLKYSADRRSTDELIDLALTKDVDADDEDYWHPIRSLQYRLPAIIERVDQLLQSDSGKSREVAADILGQNSVKEKWGIRRCADDLLSALRRETSSHILSSLLHALGNLHDPETIDALFPLAQHSDADVRYAAVHSLSGFDDVRAIDQLIRLSRDPDREVRNWATFGLGSRVDTDGPAIREALFARLEEKDDEIRGEALVGLARRGDVRVAAALLNELNAHEPHVLRDWTLIAEAAEEVVTRAKTSGSIEWQPVLTKLAALGIGPQAEIQSAIIRCTQSEE